MNILNAENKGTDKIVNIKLTDIYPDPENRRVGGFDEIKLKELSASIKSIGVMQPIIVRKKHSGRYDLVAGERRWRASKIANRGTIPAVVKDLTDEDVLHFQVIENLQREDIHPLDECHGFFRLMTGSIPYTPRDIANEIGKSESYVTQRLKLKNLIPEAETAFEENKILLGHAILIARLETEGQKKAFNFLSRDKYVYLPSISSFRAWIDQNIYLDLTNAAFPKKDDNLIKEADSCIMCRKRTDWDPALFPEINERAFCLDAKCFNKKLEQHLENQKEIERPFITDGYGFGETPAGTYMPWDVTRWKPEWDEPENEEEVPDKLTFEECLIVSGPERGKIVLAKIKVDEETKEDPEEIARHKAEKREDDISRMKHEIFNNKLFEETLGKFTNPAVHITSHEGLILNIEALIGNYQVLDNIPRTLDANGWAKIENPDDIISDLKSMSEYKLMVLLQEIIIENLIPSYWDKDNSKLKDIAAEKGVDIESLQHESRLEAEVKYEEKHTV